MRRRIQIKSPKKRGRKIKIRYLALMFGLVLATVPRCTTQAESCPSLKIIFARGSGAERWNDKNYLEFKTTIENKLRTVELDYEFVDLDYPAVGVGMDNLEVTLGAFFGSGDAYEFGESVKSGVKKLDNLINDSRCPGTKYVIGGYSQGAMVVSRTLGSLRAEQIIYAATFGDPKIYLPEGKGLIPPACKGEGLSDYRMYVPDCQAYQGLLGSYIPYEPEALRGKVGTWCNKRDIFCSSRISMSDHTAYVAEGLYEDASRVIFDKITRAFGLENKVSSPHDTAILIDSTGSMAGLIEEYKAEALRLASETLNSGGRVALYDYRDLGDPYEPVKRCDFNTCTLANFEAGLAEITTDGGGDTPESLLSASFKVMKDLTWRQGATKSLVILTDADFLAPDRDGMTFDEVVQLSKSIDPVNFYIITTADFGEAYEELAAATDGKVVTDFDKLDLLTSYIMERYDSLPRVEEGNTEELPTLEIGNTEWISNTESRVDFIGTGRTLVALNGAILGVTEENEIVISGLDRDTANRLTLVPLSADRRGVGVEIVLNEAGSGEGLGGNDKIKTDSGGKMIAPKAPNTGKAI